MFDSFLLLTPLLTLAVLALVRFIGCAEIIGVEEWEPSREVTDAPSAPTDLSVQYGDEIIILSWNPPTGATGYTVQFSDSPAGPLTDGVTVSENTSTEFLPYNVTRRYAVIALKDALQSPPSDEVTVTGARPLLATIQTFGTPQSFFNGLLGMKVTPTTRLKIVALGRVKYLNVQPNPVPIVHAHEIKIVLPGTPVASDVSGGQVAIAPEFGVEAGDFLYETLKTDIFFEPGETFYVVSQETALMDTNPDADEWHDFDTIAIPHPEATLDEGVYQPDETPGEFEVSTGGPNHLYVPVNVLYHPAPLPQP